MDTARAKEKHDPDVYDHGRGLSQRQLLQRQL